MFKTKNRKAVLSVGAVAMLMMASVFVLLDGQSDSSEAVTTLDINSEVIMSFQDLYTGAVGGTDTYAVAYGSYVTINDPYGDGGEVESISTTYGVGDNAGLTLTGGSVSGMINKTASGSVTLNVLYNDVQFQVFLVVSDLSSTSASPYAQSFHVPANLLYYQSDVYLLEGTDVLINGGTVESEADNFYEVVDVTAGSGLALNVTASGNNVQGYITDDNATVVVDVDVYDSNHSSLGSYSVNLHVVSQIPPTVVTPVEKVVGNVGDVFYPSSTPILDMSQVIANGTYIDLTNNMNGSWEFNILSINGQTIYQNVGLTLSANGVKGVLNTNLSTLEIEWEAILAGSEEGVYTSVFTVMDTSSSSSDPYRTAISMPANVFIENSHYYASVGTTVEVTNVSVMPNGYLYDITNVTPGYGLSIQSVSPYSLVGTLTTPGDITVTVEESDGLVVGQNNIVIHVSDYDHADVRMFGGETWSYTPTLNLDNPTYTLTGKASAWVSESSGTISGTAPNVLAVGTQYDLTIIAVSSNPVQTITQTVSFTVDPIITATVTYPPGESSYDSIYGQSGTWSNVFGSNFKDGTRTIFAISGQDYGYTVGSANGSLNYTPSSVGGTVTVTATSPYTYTSGNTNSVTVTVNTTVQGVLSITKSADTLYLVTGKTVPNSPSEAVTLTHSDVGAGTYVWSITGTNDSGVTINSSTGVLGGTPGAVGTYSVTIRCDSDVDGHQQTATSVLTVQIVPVLVFTSSPTEGTVTAHTP